MSTGRIYLSPPHLGDLELEFVREAFETNWISSAGPHISAFEREFCEFVGASHACALSSGTAGLHLSLVAAGVQPGQRVLCSSFTFAATVNAILYAGAEPVFIDSDRTSWNMDPDLCVAEIQRLVAEGRPPGATMPVHLYGQSVDLDPILTACAAADVPVIEDAAEALGGLYRGSHCGTLGRAGVYSFNGNKIITTSGGGMVVSEDEALIQRIRFLSTQAKEPTPDQHYLHEVVGYNYRMSNVLAGIGRGQLRVLSERVKRRREIFDLYRRALEGIDGLTFMPEPEFTFSNRWLTCILIDPDRCAGDRRAVQVALEQEDIESRPLWRPMHMQPAYSQYRSVGGAVSEELYRDGLCLPSGTAMSDDQVYRIAERIRATLTA